MHERLYKRKPPRELPRGASVALLERVGSHLGCHAALLAHTPPNLDDLARAQLSEAEATQGLHVDEDVRGAHPPS